MSAEVIHQDTITCPNCLKKTLDRKETKEKQTCGVFQMDLFTAEVQCSNLYCRYGWKSKPHFKKTFNREEPKMQMDLSEYV
jgi:hypothetical protein